MANASRRRFIGTAVGAAAAVAARSVSAGDATPPRPNVLFIMADDLARGDLSCYGRPDYRTPNLDRLAGEGVKLLDCYSNAPTCSPTRTALMTGCYQYRFPVGLYEPLLPHMDAGLSPSQPTLASVFRGGGYLTALIGKWHLGRLPGYGPLKSGYDSFFGTVGGEMGYYDHGEMTTVAGAASQPALYEGERQAQVEGYATDLFTERAVRYIERHARAPFLLSLHYTAPHWPWEPPGGVAATRANTLHHDGGSREIFARMVESLDAGVGRVLDALRRAGAYEHTIVIFTSDNGGERFSYHWPFRGAKMDLWEGGIRVPGLVRWPGRIAPGASSEQIAVSMDWLPTLAAAATIPLPDAALDGVDLTPALTRRASIERTLYWRTHRDMHAVRRAHYKYVQRGEREFLFDLATDPQERANLKKKQPTIFAELARAYAAWERDMLPIPPEARVPPGVHEALEALDPLPVPRAK